MSRKLKGVAAAPGIAIAPMVRFHGDMDFIPTRQVPPDGVPGEVARLEEALRTASRRLQKLRAELAQALSDQDARIYDAEVAILHDPTFKTDIAREVERDRVNAEVALQRVVARYQKVFDGMQDAAMRERAADVRDIGVQVMTALLEKERATYTAQGRDYIFVADEFLPSDAGILDRERLRGIVTARGGKYSHGAILARSLGIPALVAVEEVMLRAETGTAAILDGESGTLLLDPSAEELNRYQQLLSEREQGERRVAAARKLPPVTLDGAEVQLLANVESVRDLDHVEFDVVAGIGLFRTEFAFMERRTFPAENEQVDMYRAAVQRAGGKPVTFRTLDVGGDKPLAYFRTPDERNPVLGWRGLRICLDWPDILYTQVRAIVRAAAGGRARILLPMVSRIDEVRRCRAVLDQILEDLRAGGVPHSQQVELGVMVEVPAIVHVLDQVLPLVEFVSVGTNDLVQYLLAVDRDNPRVAGMYDPFSPAVLRVLHLIGEAAHQAGKPVSICGEIAGDHNFTPLLLGLGYRELSMAPVFVPRVKLAVRGFGLAECKRLATRALAMTTAAEIRKAARDLVRERWEKFVRASVPEESAG
jgi:phosphotransferase system enzyme I (PtsI)